MYDNLILWFNIIQRLVSKTAFIEGENVYVKEGGFITLIPTFDGDIVTKLMDANPHLLLDTYNKWAAEGDETFSVARTFCIVLFEQELEHEKFLNEMSPEKQAIFDQAASQIAAALSDFLGGGQVTITPFPEAPPSLSVFQNGMFNQVG